MMDWRIVFVLGLLDVAVNASGFFFVTAPNLLRYKTDENVLVSVFDRNNVDIKIWLEYDYFKNDVQHTNKFSEKTVRVADQETPRLETIRVDENDIFHKDFDETTEKPRELRLVATDGNGEKRVDLMLSYDSGYLIVHTDKPIYSPRQNVKVRVLALDESMSNALALNKTANKHQVVMDLVNPNGTIMSRSYGKPSNNGKTPFYTSELDIPANTQLGTWTIVTNFTGQFETSDRTMFEVEEYVLPTINVTVTTNISYILDTTEHFTVTVEAKYVYLKPVAGSVGLTIFLNGQEDKKPILNQPRAHLSIDKGVHVFTINAKEIVDSKLRNESYTGKFPLDEYLTIRADVFESATGNEETGWSTNIIFADKPYKFTYERSKNHYRPGWNYFLKVDVFYPNGEQAKNVEIEVSYKQGEEVQSKIKTTDNIGQCNIPFSTTSETQTDITFEVTVDDLINKFVVKAYKGANQVQVDQMEKDNKVWIHMKSNVDVTATGLLFVIMSRGKIIKSLYTAKTNERLFELEKEVLTKITPNARVLVFYVAKNAVVADSVKFDVEAVCSGDELKLTPNRREVTPGSTGELTIEGPSDMMVGLNVMDTALLLLNSKNILRRTKMFKAMSSHDRGCGEGSGGTVEEVFKNSGLTLVTDAKISTVGLRRESIKCQKKNRRKRSLDTKCQGIYAICCEKGMDYAYDLVRMNENNIDVNVYTMCEERAANLSDTTASSDCLVLLYDVCVAEYLDQTKDASSGEGRSSLDGESDYSIDLKKVGGSAPRQRNDFRESWLFDDIDLSGGAKKVVLKYPDSITQWMIQAIGFSPRDGMCIADPLYVKADRDFFIQLDLPYQAVRLERINVKATIFNYGFVNVQTINVYLHGQKDMCSAAQPGQPSEKFQLRMGKNTAQTVTFPVIPLKRSTSGNQLVIAVTAFAEGTNVNDAISKKLYIINEGIEKRKTIKLCLDPGQEKDDCEPSLDIVRSDYDNTNEQQQTIKIDLSLPKEAIPGTGSALAYIKSNIMVDAVDTIVNGVDKLLQMPSGCGEQTMIYLAPTTYAMNYLKQTKQVTDEIERVGNNAIRSGVAREMTYRKPDGSYAAWLSRPSSTWLTAFVAKVFCQAKTVVDDAVDDAENIRPTVEWLAKQIHDNGSFDDKQPVIHREMIGQISEKDQTLTAFVLISLLECKNRVNTLNEVTNKAQTFIENLDVILLRKNPYLLAISAYALSLANSGKKAKFWNLLTENKHTNGANLYWGDITDPETVANANTVETTSYALLTYLTYNQLGDAGKIVRWLTSQRNAEGSFRTTQDTVVGLQALSEYSIVTASTDVKLQLTFSADGWDKSGHTETVTKENINVLKIVENLPVETKDNQLVIVVTGSGSARMDIDLRYNIPKPDTPCAFNVSKINITTAKEPVDININRGCDVCGICKEPENPDNGALADDNIQQAQSNFGRRKRDAKASNKEVCMSFSVSLRSVDQKESGMSIVKVNLQTGMQAVKSDLKKLLDERIIDRYELTYNNQGYIVFYLDKIGQDAKEFKFRLIDEFDGDANTRQGTTVDVYDYYRPDRSCQKTYGFGDDRGKLETKCEGKHQKACECVQKICAAEPNLKYFKKPRKYKPVDKLRKRTCNNDMADYSILVTITETDVQLGHKKAVAIVKKVFNKGTQNLDTDDEITFTWKLDCNYPDMLKGKTYYVIAKDGHKTNDNGFIYPLEDRAFVIEKIKTSRQVFKLMNLYESRMRTIGCNA